jgi:iron complex outermembrane receptor protein
LSAPPLPHLGAPLLAGALAFAGPAGAQPVQQLPEVVVRDTVDPGFVPLSARTATASRLGLTLRETPASVDVVTQAQIQERGRATVVDAVRGVTGVTSAVRPGAAGVYSLRGFSENALGLLFDGIRVGGATVTTRTYDSFNFDRIDVLRGPASTLYGEGAGAGAINYVRRAPVAGPARVEAIAEASTAPGVRAGVAATGSATESVSYVFSAVGNRFETDVDNTDYRYAHIVGGLRGDLGRGAFWFAEADYLRNDVDNAYWGTPLVANRLDDSLRKINYNNSPDNRYRDTVLWLRAGVEANAGPGRYKGQVYRYEADRDWRNLYAYRFDFTNPRTVSIRSTENLGYDHTMWGTRHEYALDHPLGALASRTVGGIEYQSTEFDSPRANGGTPSVNAFNPGEIPFAFPPRQDARRADVKQTALFAENRTRLAAPLALVTGVRYNWLDADVARPVNGVAFSRDFDYADWRAGLVYDVSPNANVYAAYSTGSEPVETLLLLAPTDRQFELTRFRQAEVGTKGVFLGGRAQWQLAAYWIEKRDLTSADPANPARVVQVGKQSSRGVEAGITGRFWRGGLVEANLAVLDARYDEFFEGAVSRNGNLPPNVPEVVANLGVTQQVTQPLRLGAWVTYVDRRTADTTSTVFLPSYTLLDVWARYAVSRRIELYARLRNLTDETYVDWATRAFGQTVAYFGQGRTAEVGVRASF